MSIEWEQVILLGIGAFFGVISSVVIYIIQRIIQGFGRIKIFTKFTAIKDKSSGWGFSTDENGDINFILPTVIEFQNTSELTKICRDVNVCLYLGNKYIEKMKQMEIENTYSDDEKKYGDAGAYSFVIPPRSIKHYNCIFIKKISPMEVSEKMFNKIKFSYYDEHNRRNIRIIKCIDGNWQSKIYSVEETWNEIK